MPDEEESEEEDTLAGISKSVRHLHVRFLELGICPWRKEGQGRGVIIRGTRGEVWLTARWARQGKKYTSMAPHLPMRISHKSNCLSKQQPKSP